MMKHFITAFLCLLTTCFYAQQDKIIYLDSLGLESTYQNHDTSIKIEDFNDDQAHYNFYEYFKSGKIKAKGMYFQKWLRSKTGLYITYYENGSKETEQVFNDNMQEGAYYAWYENGTKKTEGEYSITTNSDKVKMSKLKILSYWDENGNQLVTNGNGIYKETIKTETSSGPLVSGYKHGLWEGYSGKPENLSKSYTETYADGKLVSGISFNKDGSQNHYTQLEINAGPKKGLPHFYKFVGSRIQGSIPEIRVSQLRMFGRFIVDKEGAITDIYMIKGFNSAVDAIFKETLEKYPAWNPAMQRGRPVRSMFHLPITIQTSN